MALYTVNTGRNAVETLHGHWKCGEHCVWCEIEVWEMLGLRGEISLPHYESHPSWPHQNFDRQRILVRGKNKS